MQNAIKNLSSAAFKLAWQIVGHREDACDVVQDAVQIALSHNSVPDHTGNEFKPWFFRVVRNKAIDRYRSQKGRTPDDVDVDSLAHSHSHSHSAGPEQQVEQAQKEKVLRAALDSLSLEQREMILLRDFHGMSYAEISEVTGLKQGSVMSRLHRARLALKAAFEERY